MIIEEKACPASPSDRILLSAKGLLQIGQFPGDKGPLAVGAVIYVSMVKNKEHIKLAVNRIGNELISSGADSWRLSHSQITVAGIENFPMHFCQELIQPGAILAERSRAGIAFRPNVTIRQEGIIYTGKLPISDDLIRNQGDDIHAETIYPSVHPPIHHVIHSLPDLRILPVKIRLLLGKLMKIILTPLRIKLPG